jgi:hypothetical protein
MRTIKLTNGGEALVDDEDYALLSFHSWREHKGYVETGRTPNVTYMHRMILGSNERVDHIDGNKFNNQRSNLRVASRGVNRQNSKLNSNNTSGYRGVVWFHPRGTWQVKLRVNGKTISGGYFHDARVAAMKYNQLAIQHYGEHAKTNVL